jgi:Glutaredoxin-like domain (DUF836)
MPTLTPLKLFTTSHCHLCEQAFQLMIELNITEHLALVEIADNDGLIASYGTRIPVLKRSDNLAELNWPFSKNDIINFIRK